MRVDPALCISAGFHQTTTTCCVHASSPLTFIKSELCAYKRNYAKLLRVRISRHPQYHHCVYPARAASGVAHSGNPIQCPNTIQQYCVQNIDVNNGGTIMSLGGVTQQAKCILHAATGTNQHINLVQTCSTTGFRILSKRQIGIGMTSTVYGNFCIGFWIR